MNKTLIYLHGAFDLMGQGVVDLACGPGGALRTACAARGMALLNPQNPSPLATDWHLPPNRDRVLQAAMQAKSDGHRVYLAGHSMGGRGALMIGLAEAGAFDALGAIAPALGVGIDDGALIATGASKFSPTDLQTGLRNSSISAFFGYASNDSVVQLQAWHFNSVAQPHRIVRHYEVPVLDLSWASALAAMATPLQQNSILLGPHNKLVAATAKDLVEFFHNLP